MKTPTLNLIAHQTALLSGKAQNLDLLVALRAPALSKKNKKERPSLNLAVVIDNSGSMAGAPLAHAKQATVALVQSLNDTDRISVVVYSDVARVVLESVSANIAKAKIEGVLAMVREEGMTALQAGWLTGAEQIAPFVSQYGVSRVLLLSDGNANKGETHPDVLALAGEKLAAAGISTSTYGIGNDFGEMLMTTIAQSGQGQAVYAVDADGLATYFLNEFQMLCDLAGKNVRVALEARDGQGNAVEFKCLNGFAVDNNGAFRMPSLLAGSDSWAVFSVEVDKKKAKGNIVFTAKAQWIDADGNAQEQVEEATVKFAAKAGTENEIAVERAREARAAAMAKEAAEAARVGDFARSRTVISQLSASAGNNAYVSSVAQNLCAVADAGDWKTLGKEALYSATTMSSRAADALENISVLDGGRYGLRKAAQGKAQKGEDKEAKV